MAVAPLPNVRRVVEYALTEIPAEKMWLGIPNYGYDWPLPYVSGETRAETLSPAEALALARRTGSQIEYDPDSMAPYFYYTENGVPHVVWFQDARSADSLARLANEYSLGGISIWNVMRRFPSLWQVLSSLYAIRKIP